jgi:uncharacterized protein DUF4845
VSPLPADQPKLPLWRRIAGIGVLAGMAAVLGGLSPVYLEDFRLQRYMRALVAQPDIITVPDETIRSQILTRARQLALPVEAGDIHITHSGNRTQVELKYAVPVNFPLYQVDLHFRPEARSR